jgi:two-component system, cell cycle sensor histidine kinase and response regulator CckA
VAQTPSGQDEATSIMAALQNMERRYEVLFGLNPDPVFAFDLDGRIVWANRALELLCGRSVRDLKDRSLLDMVAPEDHERTWRHFTRAARGEAQTFEMTGLAAGEREFTLAATFVPTLVDGAVEGVYGTGRDVTRAREAERALRDVEERYDLLAENMTDMISLHDITGAFLYASPSAWVLLGYHPVELIGRSVWDLIESADVAAMREAFETSIRQEGRAGTAIRARRRDGTVGWFEATARMVTHPDTGEPWRIVGVTRDISERRAFEQHLAQSQKMEALGRVAGGIAHDFNNALTVIGGHAEMLTRVLGAPPERKAAEYIREAAIRASALATQLLSFGHSAPREARVFDVNTMILDMQPLLVRVLGPDVDLSLELHPDLAPMHAEPESLRQVLMNLAVNAREALDTGEQGGRIRIVTSNRTIANGDHASLPGGAYISITVADDGPGMTADVAARVFEPFFTTKRHAEGAGLGLSSACSAVRNAGGDISLDTAPGAGSSFTLRFPASGLEPTWTPDERVVTEQLGGTETILVAEDDPGVRALIVATLERHGYSVMSAVDGRQALDLFRMYGHLIDLVVTDVNMPELTGPELARVIAESDGALPVLFISGFTADAFPTGDGEERLFLPKPFTPVQLAQSVARALARRR